MDNVQMSLLEMSANVQKTASLKRSHDDFISDAVVKNEHEHDLTTKSSSVDRGELLNTRQTRFD
jgi:hypothetical protein